MSCKPWPQLHSVPRCVRVCVCASGKTPFISSLFILTSVIPENRIFSWIFTFSLSAGVGDMTSSGASSIRDLAVLRRVRGPEKMRISETELTPASFSAALISSHTLNKESFNPAPLIPAGFADTASEGGVLIWGVGGTAASWPARAALIQRKHTKSGASAAADT